VVRTEADFARVRDASPRSSWTSCSRWCRWSRRSSRRRARSSAREGQNSLALLGPAERHPRPARGLLPNGFISGAGVERLAHYPRYLDGILDRLRTLADAPGKDRTRQSEYERMAQAYADAGGAIPLPRAPRPGSSRCAGCSRSTA
jgi:ATP-dependent helicase HrpA